MSIFHIIILIIGVGLGFYVQAIMGFSAALVALPFVLSALPMQEAVGLMSIFFFVSSSVLIYKNRKLIDKKVLSEMLVGILIGLIVGIIILKFEKPIILKKAFGVFVILFTAYLYIKNKKNKLFKKLGILFGFGSGLFSGMFSTGGPFVVVYVYNKLEKADIIRCTIIGTLGIMDFIRLPILIYSKIVNYKVFIASLYVFPFFLLALFLGQKTYKKINEKAFKNLLMILLVISGIALIVK